MDDIDKTIEDLEKRLTDKLSKHEKTAEDRVKNVLDKTARDPRGSSGSVLKRGSPLDTSTYSSSYGQVDLNRETGIEVIDRIADEDFMLGRNFTGCSLSYPTIYCETLEEFYRPYVELWDISPDTAEDLMKQLTVDAEESASQSGGGGAFGVNWPGRGCFLNGWLFAYNKAEDARSALMDPKTFREILATAAHEKLGHGFITEFTTSGQEKKAIQLWRYQVAEKFHAKVVDTPEEALLREKWNILFKSSKYLEEGYSTWIEQYILRRWSQTTETPSEPTYHDRSVDEQYSIIVEILKQIELNVPDEELTAAARRFRFALEIIFEKSNSAPDELHNAILDIQETEVLLEDFFNRAVGQPPRYKVGYLIMAKAAERLGEKCLPYAVVLAGNVNYNLSSMSNTDLLRLVRMEKKLNIDSRMAMISRVELSQENDLSELLHVAREGLNMAVPDNLTI